MNWKYGKKGGASVIAGRFPYNQPGVISDRGTVRKESFSSRSLSFSINDPSRRIDILVGHDFGKPIASRQSGTLQIEDADDAVRFVATTSRLIRHPGLWTLNVQSTPGL